jgi:hypothetical protein
VADELSAAQASLARAVATARAGEDHELAQRVRERGETIAKLLAGLFRLTRVHQADNSAFDVPVAELSRAIGELVAVLGTIRVVTVQQQVYVNEVRISSEAPGIKELGGELATHNAGGLTFHAPLSAQAVRALVAAFGQKPAPVAPRRALQQALAQRGVKTVELTARVRFTASDDDGAVGRDAVQATRRLLQALEETYDNVAAGRALNVLPLRRSVGELLDHDPRNPALWEVVGEGLPHATHAATVALVSLLVGRAAGFATTALQDLGVAALVHDIGYATLPQGIGPQDALARHPVEGARVMLRQRGFHVAKLRRLRAVLDHHRDHADPRGAPSGLGGILRLAEDYATAVRVGGARACAAEVLAAMLRGAGQQYHPALVQLLVNALGRFPPGTLVELEDGRLARSVSPVRTPETFAAPLVRVFDAKARAFARSRLDLATAGPPVRRALPG